MASSAAVPGWKLFLALFAVCLAPLVQTLHRSLAGGDAGELLAAACELGVAHPPGYPTFVMLYHMVMRGLSPWMSPAHAANLFSAAISAAAAATLGVLAQQLNASLSGSKSSSPTPSSVAAGIVAACLFLFVRLTWIYSITAEVFAMNNLFVSLLMYLTWHYASSPSVSRAMLGAFVCGLALTNQHTSVLFMVVIVPFVLWTGRSFLLTTEGVLGLGFSFGAGLVPYVYMVVSALRNTAGMTWGDQRTVAGFLKHLLRQEYGTFDLGSRSTTSTTFWDRVWLHVSAASEESNGLLFPLAGLGLLAGALALWNTTHSGSDLKHDSNQPSNQRAASSSRASAKPRHAVKMKTSKATHHRPDSQPSDVSSASAQEGTVESKTQVNEQLDSDPQAAAARVVAVFVAMWLFYEWFFNWRANLNIENPLLLGVHERFWMQPNIVLSCLAGVGFGFIPQLLGKEFPPLRAISKKLLLPTAIVLLAIQVGSNYRQRDESTNHVIHDMGKALLDPLPENTLLLLLGDLPGNAARYLHFCEGVRPDVRLFDLEMSTFDWYAPMMQQYLNNVTFPGTKPVYRFGDEHYQMKQFLDANYDKFPIFVFQKMNVDDHTWQSTYELWHFGEASRVVRQGTPLDIQQWLADGLKAVPSYELPPKEKYDERTWEHVVREGYEGSGVFFAMFFENISNRVTQPEHKKELLKASYKVYDTIVTREKPRLVPFPAYWHKNFGVTAQKLLGMTGDSQYGEKMVEQWQAYVDMQPDDPQVNDIKAIINQYRQH